MNISEIIRNRRSIFPPQYNEHPVSEEFIKKLLENANWAPTHRLTQPWRFKVVLGEAKDRLGVFLSDTYTDITSNESFSPFKHKKIINNCKSSSAIIVICMQRDLKGRVPEWEEVAATAMAVQNMWLTCAANNVGCYWSTPNLIEYVGDFFDFEEGEQCLGLFYLGNYNIEEEKTDPKRDAIEDKVQWLS
ncbi:nitroreductase [Aquimarina sp. 2201CG1-2-11]|uniref:nitroreductase family protein n=1 Tax=Aquimarina discodermiae TaxID=3231043 RepID=UPI003463456D